jgi:hypothetical protein
LYNTTCADIASSPMIDKICKYGRTEIKINYAKLTSSEIRKVTFKLNVLTDLDFT